MAQDIPSCFLKYINPTKQTKKPLASHKNLASILCESRLFHQDLPKKTRGNWNVKAKQLTKFSPSTARILAVLYERHQHCEWLWNLYIGISTAYKLLSSVKLPIHCTSITEDCVVCQEGKAKVYITQCGHCICVDCFERGKTIKRGYWRLKGCPYCKQTFMVAKVVDHVQNKVKKI
jgi:hypothetical protein